MSARPRLEAALDAAAPVVIAVCVLAAAAASSIREDLDSAGRPARWLLIGLALLLLTLHGARGIGAVHGAIAKHLLVRGA